MVENGTLLQGRFLINECIGKGGMGAVYIATDEKFGSRVAIKETFYEDAELADAFAREARILNSVHHPILPHVSDYFHENDGYFLVMEYIEGEDLSEVLKREGAFPVADVVRWSLELLDGLDYLHSQEPPVIHRDIKPHNLKLTSRGNVVLLDFGLAKETSANAQGVKSVFGYSRRYSPLEQIEGVGTDPRSDIFSLGATVFHLITGKQPIDVLARASAIIAGKPDPLQLASDLEPAVPLAVANVIKTAMALNADMRFVSARAMSNALEDAVHVSEEPSVKPVIAVKEERIATPNVEDFPALEAFRDDAEAAGDSPSVSRPSPATHVEPLAVMKIPIHRRSFDLGMVRPAVWVVLVVVALVVLGLFIFRAEADDEVSTSDAKAAEAVSEKPTAPLKKDSEASPASSKTAKVLNATDAKTTAKRTDGPEPEQSPRPEIDMVSVSERREPAASEPVRMSSATRPRRVKTRQRREPADRRPQFRQPPVSTIESIFTGIPATGQKTRMKPNN